jgi:hypothetical protein
MYIGPYEVGLAERAALAQGTAKCAESLRRLEKEK